MSKKHDEQHDPTIRAVATDCEEEHGEYPRPGTLVHIVTATYAYRGILERVSPSYYVLAPGSFLVFETGPHAGYFKNQKGTNEEECPVMRRVERGACITIESWSR